MTQHFALISNSKRLQRVLGVLQDKQRHTTLDIIQQAHVVAVSSVVSELRNNGYNIECRRSGDVWEYWIN